MQSPSSNKVQKIRFWKEKSIEHVVTLGPTNGISHTSGCEKAHVNFFFSHPCWWIGKKELK